MKTDIKERVYSYESALQELGEQAPDFTGLAPDVVAYIKLKTIARALNEGWKIDFGKKEWLYHPTFELYSKMELDKMSDDEAKSYIITRLGVLANSGATAGWRFVSTPNRFSYASTTNGFRLCVKSGQLAEYFGKQFIELWADYLLGEYETTCFKINS